MNDLACYYSQIRDILFVLNTGIHKCDLLWYCYTELSKHNPGEIECGIWK